LKVSARDNEDEMGPAENAARRSSSHAGVWAESDLRGAEESSAERRGVRSEEEADEVEVVTREARRA